MPRGRFFFAEDQSESAPQAKQPVSNDSTLVTPRALSPAIAATSPVLPDNDEGVVLTLSYELSSERTALDRLGVVAHKQSWLDIKVAGKGIWTRRFVRLHQDRLEWFLCPMDSICEGVFALRPDQCVIAAECRFALVPSGSGLTKFRTKTEDEANEWTETLEMALANLTPLQRPSPTRFGTGALLRANSSKDLEEDEGREARQKLFLATSLLETSCKHVQELQLIEERLWDEDVLLSMRIRAVDLAIISRAEIQREDQSIFLRELMQRQARDLEVLNNRTQSPRPRPSAGGSEMPFEKAPTLHPDVSSGAGSIALAMFRLSRTMYELSRLSEEHTRVCVEEMCDPAVPPMRARQRLCHERRDHIETKLAEVAFRLQRARGDLRDAKNRVQHYEQILEHVRHRRMLSLQRISVAETAPQYLGKFAPAIQASQTVLKRSQESAGLLATSGSREDNLRNIDEVKSQVLARHADRVHQRIELMRTELAFANLIT